jgi:hypothetical protein
MDRDAQHYQRDARGVLDGRDLAQHDRAHDRGEDRQQRQHHREGGARQPGHGQLIGYVRDHGGADAHPGPGQQQERMPERGQRAAEPRGCRRDRRDRHRCRKPVDVRQPTGARSPRIVGVRHPVGEDDVQHEQRAVGKGEDEAEGLSDNADRGDRDHARGGEHQGSGVTPGPRAGRGQDDGAEEFDGAHRGQRQPVRCQVERRVHRREHHAQRRHPPAVIGAEPADQPPRPPPHREQQRGAGDPQPCDPEHVQPREQQHRQRRTQIMEDGADQEERLRRQPVKASLNPGFTTYVEAAGRRRQPHRGWVRRLRSGWHRGSI